MTRQEQAYLDAEVELLQRCKERDICDICDGKECVSITSLKKHVMNTYVEALAACVE